MLNPAHFLLASDPEEPAAEMHRLQVSAVNSSGVVLRKGLGFLYDEKTIVCSYTDIQGAARIEVDSGEGSTFTSDLLAFQEAMDLAILSAPEELPGVAHLVSSSTVGIGDSVSYWTERNASWEKASGKVYQILDTGKGYSLILIESSNYSSRSTPLFDSDGRTVGWLQGKRAIPMETIAKFAERQASRIPVSEMNKLTNGWKFQKPATSVIRSPAQSQMVQVSGPGSHPFRLNLPSNWTPKVLTSRGRFHVRYEHSGVCIEVRATPLQEDNILAALEREENLVFTDFSRAEMTPYSADYLTGFRASYEDNDPLKPYSLDVFYTSSANQLYLVSIAYPKSEQQNMADLVDQIFASFRF